MDTFSADVTELHCEKHGKQSVAPVFAGISFCPVCIRDKLLELGIEPVHERVTTITADE